MRPKTSRFNQHAFTLAELLVVITLVGITFSIARPALNHISGRSKLESATNVIHAAAKLARQHAITHKQPTYLVFHDTQSSASLAYQNYAIFTIDIHHSPVTQNDGYFIQNWKRLPAGVIFDPDANVLKNLFTISTEAWQGALNANNELRIDGVSYVTLGFKPSGKAASASHFIHLASGMVIDGQPIVFRPGPGKQIHFTTLGKSGIIDTRYGKNAGEFELLGEVK
ncbi:MAG: prepilin-type N-terminal cleavage/methylation domain-containing protein [Pontiella sp.]